jgi:hypothetical protein
LHPHGETVVGDAGLQRHRTPPERSEPGVTVPKAWRGRKIYARGLDNSGNIEGNTTPLFAPASRHAPSSAPRRWPPLAHPSARAGCWKAEGRRIAAVRALAKRPRAMAWTLSLQANIVLVVCQISIDG